MFIFKISYFQVINKPTVHRKKQSETENLLLHIPFINHMKIHNNIINKYNSAGYPKFRIKSQFFRL